MSLSYYQDVLTRLIRQQSKELQSGDIDRAIASAVARYSEDAPRRLVADFAWPTTGHFSATAPAEFAAESVLYAAEFPIGEQPPRLVQVAQAVTPAGVGLACETQLAAGSVVRLTFSAAHVVRGGDQPLDTVPERHRAAVADYAAHLLCRELATLYSAERESSLAADGANTQTRASAYAARAKEFRASYFASLGMADPIGSAAGGGGASAAGEAAGAVVSWGQRTRSSFRPNDTGLGPAWRGA